MEGRVGFEGSRAVVVVGSREDGTRFNYIIIILRGGSPLAQGSRVFADP